MKFKNKLLLVPILVISILVSSACSLGETSEKTAPTDNLNNSSKADSTDVSKSSDSIKSVSVKYEREDYYFDWRSQSYQSINLSKGSSNITKSGIYEITGTLNDGSLVVNVDKSVDKNTVYIVLNNVKISEQ